MTEKRYSLLELRAMTKLELTNVAKPLGVKVNKSINKGEVVKRIMRVYSDAVVSGEAKNGTPDLNQEKTILPESESFEALASDAEVDQVMGAERRGGARPGAGRPKGMTEKKARMAHLPEQPHEMILLALSGAFELWASKSGVPEVALTKAEAVELALPLTRLGEYYGVTKWLPEELMLWLAPVWATHSILKVKRQIITEAKGGKDARTPGENNHDLRQERQRQDDRSQGTSEASQPCVVL